MWRNNGKTPLYVVKRKHSEMYHCGSYSSTTPKLYMIGHAKTACKKLNNGIDVAALEATPLPTRQQWIGTCRWRASMKPQDVDEAYSNWCDHLRGGPWVVCEMQIAASEIEID